MKTKGVNIRVDENYYKKLDAERRKFMEKYGLNKLTTVAFTGMLTKKGLMGSKNVKK